MPVANPYGNVGPKGERLAGPLPDGGLTDGEMTLSEGWINACLTLARVEEKNNSILLFFLSKN